MTSREFVREQTDDRIASREHERSIGSDVSTDGFNASRGHDSVVWNGTCRRLLHAVGQQPPIDGRAPDPTILRLLRSPGPGNLRAFGNGPENRLDGFSERGGDLQRYFD